MISRVHRFHGQGSLNRVYRAGKIVRGPYFAIKYSPAPSAVGAYRAAVVVSKKVSKSAVVRNRIRRRIYEVLRFEALVTTQPYDIVVTVFNDKVAEIPFEELKKSLTSQLEACK